MYNNLSTNPATPSDIVIQLGELSDNVGIQIYDDTATSIATLDSVGRITIVSSNSNSNVTQLWIAAEDENNAFSNPNFALTDNGLANVGELRFVQPDGVTPDTQLRDRTSVNYRIAGDIRGDVIAGQIFRLDARRRGTETLCPPSPLPPSPATPLPHYPPQLPIDFLRRGSSSSSGALSRIAPALRSFGSSSCLP